MAIMEAPWSTDDGLVGFVRREQEQLVRLAFLVRGDPGRAEQLVEDSLVAVGRRWSQVGDESPGLEVRRVLCRRAVADDEPGPEPTRAGAEPASRTTEDGDWSAPARSAHELAHRAEVAGALARLTSRQRAVLALVGLERATVGEAARMLGVLPRTVRHDAVDALDRLRAALPGERLGDGRADSPSVRRVLEEAVEDVPPPDLADAVVRRCDHDRGVVRRRALLVAGGVVGVGAVTYLVADRLQGAGPPPWSSADPLLESTTLRGTVVVLAPSVDEEPSLPLHPERAALPVPDPIGPGDPVSARPMPVGGVDEPVLAVYLVHDERGVSVPVLQTRVGGGTGVWEVSGARLYGDPDYSQACGPSTISRDRRRVVLPSPSSLVVIDLSGGRVLQVPVVRPTLRRAGWAADDRTVVAHGRDDAWVVDPSTSTVREASTPVSAGRHELAWTGGTTQARSFSLHGTLTTTREVPGPPTVPYGPSSSTGEGWVAAPAYLPGAYDDRLGRTQGVVVVAPDAGEAPRVLAARGAPSSTAQRYRVLGWAREGSVLVESIARVGGTGDPRRLVLLWDVPTGRLWRVQEVLGVGQSGSWFTGQWAL